MHMIPSSSTSVSPSASDKTSVVHTMSSPSSSDDSSMKHMIPSSSTSVSPSASDNSSMMHTVPSSSASDMSSMMRVMSSPSASDISSMMPEMSSPTSSESKWWNAFRFWKSKMFITKLLTYEPFLLLRKSKKYLIEFEWGKWIFSVCVTCFISSFFKFSSHFSYFEVFK